MKFNQTLINSRKATQKNCIEPWAEGFDLLPNQEIRLEIIYEQSGMCPLEISVQEHSIVLYHNSGRLNAFIEDKIIFCSGT